MTDESAHTTPGADVGSGALRAAHAFDIAGVRVVFDGRRRAAP